MAAGGRQLVIVGNWKMNLDAAGSAKLARELAQKLGGETQVEVGVCPPFVYLAEVARALQGTNVRWGAQNCWCEPKGAFTGEVAAPMLKDLGCRYVILGHSERRHVLGEKDELIARKLRAALAAQLTPIVCVGELLAERQAGRTSAVITAQLEGSLAALDAAGAARLIIAYEPVWAIGTGQTATPAQAQEVHALIRQWLARRFGAPLAGALRLQYGGSVKPDNARELLRQPDVDGALVGGASLEAESFAGIVAGGRG